MGATVKLHDTIKLTRELASKRLPAGAVGTVVHIYPKACGYEIEFPESAFLPPDNSSSTITVNRADVEPVTT